MVRGLDTEMALETRWRYSKDRRKKYWDKLRQKEAAQAEAARKVVQLFLIFRHTLKSSHHEVFLTTPLPSLGGLVSDT